MLALFIMIFIKPMLMIMSVNNDILVESATYIRIESVALIFSVLSNFVLVVLITLNKVSMCMENSHRILKSDMKNH